MARYDKAHKAESRERIITAAGRRLRLSGIDGSGIATVMEDAGLTNGAFYAHFASKENLVATSIGDQLQRQHAALLTLLAEGGIAAFIDSYLSAEHRDNPADGCPSAALLEEVARSAAPIRASYAQGAATLAAEIADAVRTAGGTDDPGRVSVALAMMIGTMQLCRALTGVEADGAPGTDQILAEARIQTYAILGLPPPQPAGQTGPQP